MTTGRRSPQAQDAGWSAGKPPNRAPTAEDWEHAPRLCSLAWAAWLVGMPDSTFSDLMTRDPRLRERLSYRSPTGGRRWFFTARVWDWVDGRDFTGLHLVGGKEGSEGAGDDGARGAGEHAGRLRRSERNP